MGATKFHHIEGAVKSLELQLTEDEIAAIITHVAMYAGWPKGWAVFRLAKDVWSEEE